MKFAGAIYGLIFKGIYMCVGGKGRGGGGATRGVGRSMNRDMEYTALLFFFLLGCVSGFGTFVDIFVFKMVMIKLFFK